MTININSYISIKTILVLILQLEKPVLRAYCIRQLMLSFYSSPLTWYFNLIISRNLIVSKNVAGSSLLF